jgi:basic membrane protein A
MLTGRRRRPTIIWAAVMAAAAIAAIVAAAAFFGLIPGSENPVSRSADTSQALKVAVVTDALFDDGGWGTSSLDAAGVVRDRYDFEVTTQDNVSIADIEPTLTKYAEDGYDLIIAHGVQWGDPAVRVGQHFPNVKIVVFTGLVKSHNVASVFPMQQEGSFLLGALAGMVTKTNVVGYVGGEEYPNVINVFEGFKQGARTVNPEVKVVGTYLNDWDNPAKGKEAANSLIRQQGVDVIFQVADSSGKGVIEAANDNGIYALGAVRDQNPLAPGTVLSSFVLDVEKAYDGAVQSVVNGTFEGRIAKPGIEVSKGASGEGIVFVAPFHSLDNRVPDAVRLELEKLTSDLVEGRLVVPERLEASQ